MWMGWGFLARTPVLEQEQWHGHMDNCVLSWLIHCECSVVSGPCFLLHHAPQRLNKEIWSGIFLRNNADTSCDCGHYPWISLVSRFPGMGSAVWGASTVPWERLDFLPVQHPCLWSIHAGMLPSRPSQCSACGAWVSHGNCLQWGDGAAIGANGSETFWH